MTTRSLEGAALDWVEVFLGVHFIEARMSAYVCPYFTWLGFVTAQMINIMRVYVLGDLIKTVLRFVFKEINNAVFLCYLLRFI